MTEEQKIISVEIDVDKAINRLNEVNQSIDDLKKSSQSLRKEQDDLKKSIESTGDADGELSKKFNENTQKLAENQKQTALLKGEQKTLVGAIQSQATATASLGDSYNEVNARLVQLQKEYKSLSAEQRDSDGGRAMLKQIGEQKQALKDMDATMGDFQRNVGNYPQVMSGAFGTADGILNKFGTSVKDLSTGGFGAFQSALKSGITGIKTFSKTLLTTPLGWLLAAISAVVAVFDKLRDAFKKNDDAGTAMARMMASFRPIINIVNKAFDKLASAIGWVANKIAELVGNFSEESKAMQQLVLDQDALEDKEREFAKNKAKREADIAELREKAMDSEEYSVEQRKKFLQEASELERKNFEEAIAVQNEKIRLFKEEAKANADTSDEMKNQLNELELARDNYRRDEANAQRTLQKQLQRLDKEQTASIKAEADKQKQINEERLQVIKEKKEEEIRILQERVKIADTLSKAYSDALLDNMADGVKKQKIQENERYKSEVESLRNEYDAKFAILANDDERTRTWKIEQQATLNAILEQKEIEHYAKLAEISENADIAEQQAEAERQKKIQEFTEAEISRIELEKQNDFLKKIEENELKKEQTLQFLQEEADLTIEQRQALNDKLTEIDNANEDLRKQYRVEKALESLEAVKCAFDAMDALQAESGAKSKAFAIASKSVALGELAINTGKAISAGVAQAQSVPFPANISAIAVTIATVLANIATAKKTISGAKFAEGGIVGGQSFVGDKVQVNVNSGEMILNDKQQARLFDIANSGMVANGIDYEALATAMSNTPPPIMDYKEFTDFQERTANYNEIATL